MVSKNCLQKQDKSGTVDYVLPKNIFFFILPCINPFLKSTALIGERPIIVTFFIEIQLGPLHVTINILLFLSNFTKPKRAFHINCAHFIQKHIYNIIITLSNNFVPRNKLRVKQRFNSWN